MMAAIANHLWQSTLFTVMAGLIAFGLSSYRAKIRFWIWFAASVKFLVPFSILIGVGAQIRFRPVGEAPVDFARNATVSIRMAQPFGREVRPLLTKPAALAKPDWLSLSLAALWSLGSCLLAMKRYKDWRMIQSTLRSSAVGPSIADIEVRYCNGKWEPSVVGWRRNVLLLPTEIHSILSAAQLQAVLAHETCHARRNDNLLATLHMVVETLFWFHPLVWCIGAQLIAERESACDEEVLEQGADPGVYAQAILALCRLCARSPLAAASGVTGRSLKQRIEAIMNHRPLRELDAPCSAVLAVIGATILAAPIVTGMLNAPLLHAQTLSVQRFATVSIKRCGSIDGTRLGEGYVSGDGVLRLGCLPLADEHGLGLIQRAYVRFGPERAGWPTIIPVQGRPSWFESDFFDVTATAAPDTPRQIMEGPMLRAALEDRFHLKLHKESVTIPVYTLVADSDGPRITAFVEGSCVTQEPGPMVRLPEGQRYCTVRAGVQPPHLAAEGVTLAEFSELLTLIVNRPVLDTTKIAGRFNIRFEFAPDATTPRYQQGGDLIRFVSAPKPGTPDVTGALKQLGFRLERGVGARKQIVIDHVERPTISLR